MQWQVCSRPTCSTRIVRIENNEPASQRNIKEDVPGCGIVHWPEVSGILQVSYGVKAGYVDWTIFQQHVLRTTI